LKSYAVYLLPGLALACGVLLGAPGAKPPVVMGVGLASAAVVVAGLWALLTTETRKLYAVSIGPGLWISLAGYAAIAAAAWAHASPEIITQWRTRRG
jgi:hypothetical protein